MQYEQGKIAARIKAERKKRGLSQDTFAELLNVNRNTITAWERPGDKGRIPPLEDLLKMCSRDLFDCEIGYLLCEHDCKTQVATDIQKVTGLSEKAIETLKNEKQHDELLFAIEDKLNGKPVQSNYERAYYQNTTIINYLLENLADCLATGANNSVIQLIRRYFTFYGRDNKVLTLLDFGDARIDDKTKTTIVGGAHFPLEELADMYLIQLQSRLKECRVKFIEVEKAEKVRQNKFVPNMYSTIDHNKDGD